MPIPDRKAIVRPLLRVLADGQDHSSVEIREAVADYFELSPEDRGQQAGNSTQHRFTNEHAFALVDLQRLQLITKPEPRRFVYRITERGRKALDDGSLPPDNSVFDRGREASGRLETPVQQRRAVDEGQPFVAEAPLTSEPIATHDDTSTREIRRIVSVDGPPALEGYEYWRPEARVVAEQREFQLVARFRDFLTAAGHEHCQEQLRVGDGWITHDLCDVSRGILFEAKADAFAREQLRMAIGQLFDYGYHGFESRRRRIHKAVLLPAAPPDDLGELLGYLEIGIAYEGAEREFVEEYPWA